MKIENTKAQMRKGVLEFCILSILNNGDAYTSEILSTLKSAEMIVVEGTIYPLLTRLKNTGLLTYRWEESTSGPPRKYYVLTENGGMFLKELDKTWHNLVNSVHQAMLYSIDQVANGTFLTYRGTRLKPKHQLI